MLNLTFILCISSAQKNRSVFWKMSSPVNFRWNFRRKILLHQKIRLRISEGGLGSYFWAIVLIFPVISILGDFSSLLPARNVTVKILNKRRTQKYHFLNIVLPEWSLSYLSNWNWLINWLINLMTITHQTRQTNKTHFWTCSQDFFILHRR